MRCHPVEIVILLVLGLYCALGPADAQRPEHVPRLGDLGLDQAQRERIATFLDGLHALGYVDGQNIAIEYRWAEGHFDRLPALAAELVGLPVDILVTVAGPLAVHAAQQVITTTPIVAAIMNDSVAGGVVTSLARPGGEHHRAGVSRHRTHPETSRDPPGGCPPALPPGGSLAYRRATALPLTLGFGLRTGADLRRLHGLADMGILGTVILTTWEQGGAAQYERLLQDLRAATIA